MRYYPYLTKKRSAQPSRKVTVGVFGIMVCRYRLLRVGNNRLFAWAHNPPGFILLARVEVKSLVHTAKRSKLISYSINSAQMSNPSQKTKTKRGLASHKRARVQNEEERSSPVDPVRAVPMPRESAVDAEQGIEPPCYRALLSFLSNRELRPSDAQLRQLDRHLDDLHELLRTSKGSLSIGTLPKFTLECILQDDAMRTEAAAALASVFTSFCHQTIHVVRDARINKLLFSKLVIPQVLLNFSESEQMFADYIISPDTLPPFRGNYDVWLDNLLEIRSKSSAATATGQTISRVCVRCGFFELPKPTPPVTFVPYSMLVALPED